MTEYTSRYEAIGIPLPDPDTMCKGPCEGTGVFPIKRDDPNPLMIVLWLAAEGISPNEPGDEWHFVRCPDCGGTGRAV